MHKQYHLKSCLLLTATLTSTVLLIPRTTSQPLELWPALVLVMNLFVTIFTCWIALTELKMRLPGKWSSAAKFIVSLLTGTMLILTLDYLLDAVIPKHLSIDDPTMHPGFLTRLSGALFLSVICVVLLNILFTRDMLQHARLEVEQLKQAQLQTQLMSLQQQLSPHFLFNSLSTLKSLAKDSMTKEFIMQLSLIYRYLLAGNERQIVTLADELEFVQAYLYILKQRFGIALQVSLDLPDRYLQTILPSLSLQLLLENAIKHNAFSHEEPLVIEIYIDANNHLIVNNNHKPKKSNTESLGMGLQNIRDRFHLLFNKDITVHSHKDYFTVYLPLTENEDHHH